MKITSLIFTAILFCGFNFTVLSQPIEIIFTAATDTLTRAEVNAKLSEYDIDELEANGFIAIIDEGVTTIGYLAFRSCSNLTKVELPFATRIGNGAFSNCYNLKSINTPNIVVVGNGAFDDCKSLTTVDLPLVKYVNGGAFAYCENLTTVSFGTGFENPTTILFSLDVFYDGWSSSTELTQNIDLILGSNVLPLPDLEANTWQYIDGNLVPGSATTPYVWKSITIYSSIEETIKKRTVNIYPNPTVSSFTVSFELEKSCNMKIILCDILGAEFMQIYDGFATVGNFSETVKTENLASGIYFLKILIDGKYTVEKVVLE
jgi:hypothetical protein